MNKPFALITFILALAMPAFTGILAQEPFAPVETKKANTMGSLWGVGIKAGISGVGLEVIKGLGSRVNARLGYSRLVIPYTTNQNLEGYNLQIDAEVTLGGANLLIDYYVARNIFHVTGGLIFNQTLIGVHVKSLSSLPYGDIEIPAEDVGTISGQLGPGNRLSPYLAIGVGNTLSRKHRISFNFELGTLYQGAPEIELSGSGVIGPMASESNTEAINRAIAQYSWFPMLNFQLTYRIT